MNHNMADLVTTMVELVEMPREERHTTPAGRSLRIKYMAGCAMVENDFDAIAQNKAFGEFRSELKRLAALVTDCEVRRSSADAWRVYADDPRTELVTAIRDAGIAIDEPERIAADGKLARFHVEGDRRGSRNGWAALFDDVAGVAVSFGHWKRGASGTWSLGRGRLTKAERAPARGDGQAHAPVR
jgi:hypothetical protein